MKQSVPLVHFEHDSMNGTKSIEITGEQFSLLKYFYKSIMDTVHASNSNNTPKVNAETLFDSDLSDYTSVKVLQFDGDKIFVDIRRKVPNQQDEQQQQQQQQQNQNQNNFVKISGIALRENEWEILVANIEQLENAIRAGDLNYRLEVSLIYIIH